jgi:hypothetical protein
MPLVFVNPLSLVVIGVVALILAYAAGQLLGTPLAELAGRVPIIGDDLRRGIRHIIDGVIGWALNWAKTAVNGVVELVAIPVRAIEAGISGAVVGVEAAVAAIGVLGAATVGQIGSLSTAIAQVWNRAIAAAGTAAAALTQTNILHNIADDMRARLIPQARTQAVAQAGAYTNARVDRLRADTDRALALAASAAGALVIAEQAARRAGDNAQAAELAREAARLQSAVIAAQAAAAHYTDLRTATNSDAIANLRDVAIPAALAAALAATRVVSQELTRIRTRCVDPLCGAFGPSVDVFNLLNTGVLVATVMGLVAAAASDPQGSARQVAAGGSALFGMGQGLLGAVGVRV